MLGNLLHAVVYRLHWYSRMYICR